MYSVLLPVTLAYKAMCKHYSTVLRGNVNTLSQHLLLITQVTLISLLDSFSFLKVSAIMSIYCNNEKESNHNHILGKKQELLLVYLIRED